MNRWKAAFFILAGISALSGAGAAYALLDQGVTLTYMQVGYTDTIRDLEVLRHLMPEAGGRLSRADLLALLRRQNPGAVIAATDSTVAIGQLAFYFDANDRLRTIAHPSSQSARLGP